MLFDLELALGLFMVPRPECIHCLRLPRPLRRKLLHCDVWALPLVPIRPHDLDRALLLTLDVGRRSIFPGPGMAISIVSLARMRCNIFLNVKI